MSRVRLGTRGSSLALAQSGQIVRMLEERVPGLSIELVEIRTSGDRIQAVPLGPELGQSFFTKEIEQALLDDRIDLAVHSCKDLATTLPEGLVISAVPEREDPRDALLSRSGTLNELAPGARVGTSSPRRKGFLAAARPDLDIRDQRGNVPTRVAALDAEEFDAVVLAAAGLKRLGLQHRISEIFDPGVVLPAAGQGALALQTRSDDVGMRSLLLDLDHSSSHTEVLAERACLRQMQAGCQAPVGASASVTGDSLTLRAAVLASHGIVGAEATTVTTAAEVAGRQVAEEIMKELGVDSLRGFDWTGQSHGGRV